MLLIGIHREELAFGDQVAAGLADLPIELLRIPQGVSGRHPRPDQVFRAQVQHRELYHQVGSQVRGRYRLIMDLHCGLDDDGPSVDVLSPDPRLLACIEQQARADGGPPRPVRAVLILGRGRVPAPIDGVGDPWTPPAVATRTLIPPEIWDAADLDYAGIEVYRRDEADPDAVDLARWLIRITADCFSRRQRSGTRTDSTRAPSSD